MSPEKEKLCFLRNRSEKALGIDFEGRMEHFERWHHQGHKFSGGKQK